MKKYIRRIACGITVVIMMFALVGCGEKDLEDVIVGEKDLEDVIVGTWDVTWSSKDFLFRSDGSMEGSLYTSYNIDGDMLYLYYYDTISRVYEVEIISNDSLKLIKIDDDGTRDDKVHYMDRVS